MKTKSRSNLKSDTQRIKEAALRLSRARAWAEEAAAMLEDARSSYAVEAIKICGRLEKLSGMTFAVRR